MSDPTVELGGKNQTPQNDPQDRILAAAAAETEKKMSLREGLRTYPKAIAFSMVLSLVIIMEGYDVNLISGFFAFGPFQKRFGVELGDGTYQVTAAWQAGLSNGCAVGEIIGLMINGWASERFGYKRTLLTALVFLTCFIFILFFAHNVVMLEVGQILCGIPWGVFQTLTTVYAAEVVPVNMRQLLTTYVNLCWVLGTIVGQGVLRGFLNTNNQWAYRIPFGLQWVWVIPIFIGVILSPESPWWLVRNGHLDEAKRSVKRLQAASYQTDAEIDATVTMMSCTNELEKEIETGASYLDCFRGTDLRRTEIACAVWAIQNLCGSTFFNYSDYFFENAGLASSNSFDLAMGQYAMGAIGTMTSWFLMEKLGRRSIYLIGSAGLFILFLITGLLGFAPASNTAAPWVAAALIMVATFLYDLTVGPLAYVLVPEVSSGRLRTRTTVLARGAYIILSIVTNVICPYMLNPSNWNWKAKSALVFAFCSLVSFVWCYYRLVEPKGRSYAELDELFAKGVSARKFKQTRIDIFDVDSETVEQVVAADVLHSKGDSVPFSEHREVQDGGI